MAIYAQIAENSKASQGTAELHWLLMKVAQIQPKVILEIGVHLGHSLKTWQDAFMPEKLIGVDHETNETLQKYLEDGELQAYFIQADSHLSSTFAEVQEALDGQQVDFLFIDGDHLYEGVKRDFELYAPLVREGGIIAFDDMELFDNPTVEVYQFWEEIKQERPWFSIHDDSNGIGVIYA